MSSTRELLIILINLVISGENYRSRKLSAGCQNLLSPGFDCGSARAGKLCFSYSAKGILRIIVLT